MNPVQLLMDGQAIDRALTRITHQILENVRDLSNFGIVGMQTRGVYMARRMIEKINALEKTDLAAGVLDIALYRDDYRMSIKQPNVKVTDIPFDINGRHIVLVDDVLYTGRTIRSALSALMDFGRPRAIQLAVLVDRGNYELPIRADYVGLQQKTLANQEVRLRVKEIDGEDSLWLMEIDKGT